MQVNRLILSKIVTKMGLLVDEAADGAEAVALVSRSLLSRPYAFVLLVRAPRVTRSVVPIARHRRFVTSSASPNGGAPPSPPLMPLPDVHLAPSFVNGSDTPTRLCWCSAA